MCPSPANVQPAPPSPRKGEERRRQLQFRCRASNPGQGASPVRFSDRAALGRALRPLYMPPCVVHHRRRGHTMSAIDSISPASAGMTARPAIQARSISAAVA
jgi:hypothetical protein